MIVIRTNKCERCPDRPEYVETYSGRLRPRCFLPVPNVPSVPRQKTSDWTRTAPVFGNNVHGC